MKKNTHRILFVPCITMLATFSSAHANMISFLPQDRTVTYLSQKIDYVDGLASNAVVNQQDLTPLRKSDTRSVTQAGISRLNPLNNSTSVDYGVNLGSTNYAHNEIFNLSTLGAAGGVSHRLNMTDILSLRADATKGFASSDLEDYFDSYHTSLSYFQPFGRAVTGTFSTDVRYTDFQPNALITGTLYEFTAAPVYSFADMPLKLGVVMKYFRNVAKSDAYSYSGVEADVKGEWAFSNTNKLTFNIKNGTSNYFGNDTVQTTTERGDTYSGAGINYSQPLTTIGNETAVYGNAGISYTHVASNISRQDYNSTVVSIGATVGF